MEFQSPFDYMKEFMLSAFRGLKAKTLLKGTSTVQQY